MADRPPQSSRGFIELCAGTAALTYARHGVRRPVSLQGSKDTLATRILTRMGWHTRPAWAILVDRGEWARTNRVLLQEGQWDAVAACIEAWVPVPERELYETLRTTAPDSQTPVVRAATHLFLQARTFRGKEVHPQASGWKTHGFDPEYRAATLPGAKDRGFSHARPALAQRLRQLSTVPWCPIQVVQLNLAGMVPWYQLQKRIQDADVYLDPPYAGQQAYQHGLTPAEVHALLDPWNVAAFSEGTPVELPGWTAEELPGRRRGTQLARAAHSEWLMHRTPGHP